MLPQYAGPALVRRLQRSAAADLAAQLADIAIASRHLGRPLPAKSRAAMLPFSGNGSARHPNVANVQQATELVRRTCAATACGR